MKYLKFLVLLFAIALVIPFVAYAEGEETAEEDNRVVVYFFHGDGCSHCAETEEWFESIQEEYGSKFLIKEYEVWYNTENAELMQKVSDMRNDNATGVPYIVVGDKSWIGFDKDTMAPEILGQIDELYEVPVSERYDAVALAGGNSEVQLREESKAGDVAGLIIILVIVAGVCFGVYKAREKVN